MSTRPPAHLPIEGRLPGFDGASGWLNSPPLTNDDLREKVVLVQFWTFTCINWIRTLPYVRAWADKYKGDGLVVIGVHTPEFGFEHDLDNIRGAAGAMGVEYPIVVDNDYAVWRAFDNDYWPALYFADGEGSIRDHHFGEERYEESERAIQQLLGENGAEGARDELVSLDPTGVDAAADWDTLQSPETYVGYLRAENFASDGGLIPEQPHVYEAAARLRLNEWALSGDWTVQGQPAISNEAGGRLAHRFEARDANLVIAPSNDGKPVRFRVWLDDQPPGPSHGLDIGEDGHGTVSEGRLYQLIRQPGPVAERTLEIEFLEPGAQAYVFTFG